MARYTVPQLIDAAVLHLKGLTEKNIQRVEDDIGDEIFISGVTIDGWRTGEIKARNINEADLIAFVKEVYDKSFMSWRWVRELLNTAWVEDRDQRLREICGDADITPTEQIRVRPPLVRGFIPPGTYSRFIERTEAERALLKALDHHSRISVLYSFGGMGKSSLAIDIARRIKERAEGM